MSAITDAANAAGRLSKVFEAELLEETNSVDEDLPVAIEVKGATFTWDLSLDEQKDKAKKQHQSKFPSQFRLSKHNEKVEANKNEQYVRGVGEKVRVQAEAEKEQVFQIKDVSMVIPRGMFVAVVGPVGSGKTSLLQGLIGEMRKTSGNITFGGSVGYCQQSAWVQVGADFFTSYLNG